jgi:DNA polymerase-3 subunit alpha/error-prone DNA polymerase
MLLIHHKLEVNTPLLIEEPTKEYKFPIIERSILEDAFDEIELLSFPVSCSPFDLLE